MSPAPAIAGNSNLAVIFRSEQRSHQRYALRLDVEYKLLSRGHTGRLGSTRTVNIASGGVLLDKNESLPAGCAIELLINWPFLLEGVCPLKLIMRGRIVRSDGMGVAIQAKQHEFRTAGARAQKSKPPDVRVRSLTG
jgi:hypothetical protein